MTTARGGSSTWRAAPGGRVERARDHRGRSSAPSRPVIRSTEGVAKYFPDRTGDFSVLWAPERGSGPFVEADLPVPPANLWMCFEGDEAEYRELGQRDVSRCDRSFAGRLRARRR